jgi:hypothetical protein
MYIFIISPSFLLRIKNISDKSNREDQNTVTLFFENRTVCETKCRNSVEAGRQAGRPHGAKRNACRIPKATHTAYK